MKIPRNELLACLCLTSDPGKSFPSSHSRCNLEAQKSPYDYFQVPELIHLVPNKKDGVGPGHLAPVENPCDAVEPPAPLLLLPDHEDQIR